MQTEQQLIEAEWDRFTRRFPGLLVGYCPELDVQGKGLLIVEKRHLDAALRKILRRYHVSRVVPEICYRRGLTPTNGTECFYVHVEVRQQKTHR